MHKDGGLECRGKTKTLSMIYFISGSIRGIPINNNHRTRSSQNFGRCAMLLRSNKRSDDIEV